MFVVSHTHTHTESGGVSADELVSKQSEGSSEKSSQGGGEDLGVPWFQCKHRFHQQLEQRRAEPGPRTLPAGRTAAFTPTHTHTHSSWCQQTDPQVHRSPKTAGLQLGSFSPSPPNSQLGLDGWKPTFKLQNPLWI